MKDEILLEMRNIRKEFPSVKALDGVSIKVRRGTVHALMGENGAGSSVSRFLLKQGRIFLQNIPRKLSAKCLLIRKL